MSELAEHYIKALREQINRLDNVVNNFENELVAEAALPDPAAELARVREELRQAREHALMVEGYTEQALEAQSAKTADVRAWLNRLREAGWKLVTARQPMLLGTEEDNLYQVLCECDFALSVPLAAVAASAVADTEPPHEPDLGGE